MKAKLIALLLFVGVCTLLVAATVIAGLEENQQATGSDMEQRYSYSLGATPTPIPTVDFSEMPDLPPQPAQYDEGAEPPTPKPDDGEDHIDT